MAHDGRSCHSLFQSSVFSRSSQFSEPSRLKLRIVAKPPNTKQIDLLQKPAVALTTGEIDFVPILYRRAGRGGVLGFLVVLFSVTYRITIPVERTIPSLATTLSTIYKLPKQLFRSETFQPRGAVGQLPRLGFSESTGKSPAAWRTYALWL